MASNENNENPLPPPNPSTQSIRKTTKFIVWKQLFTLGEDAPPLGFDDAVEQQPDLDEENRRRFPQIPALALHPWEGIEQEHIEDDEDDDDDDEQEMNILEDNLNHEQEQLNRLQGIRQRLTFPSMK